MLTQRTEMLAALAYRCAKARSIDEALDALVEDGHIRKDDAALIRTYIYAIARTHKL